MSDQFEAREFRTPAGRWYITAATTDEADPGQQFLSKEQAETIADKLNMRPAIPAAAPLDCDPLRRALTAADNILSLLEAEMDTYGITFDTEDQPVLDGAKADLAFARQFLPAQPDPIATPHASPEELRFAQTIVDSDTVIRTYAATEWDCLHEDGKQWLAIIIREAIARHTPAPATARAQASDEELSPFLPDSIKAAKRCGIQKSPWLSDWFIPWSPRNDNENAEGPWSDWVNLAHEILRYNNEAMAAMDRGDG